MEILRTISKILGAPILAVLWLYQRTLSPDHGLLSVFFPYGYCKYYPSCSVFAVAVLKKEGFFGLGRIIKRVYSCNPKSQGGLDYPYPKI